LDDIRRAQRDCEILAEKLKSNPKRAAVIFQCIVDNKLDQARKIPKELGIEEKESRQYWNFTAEGGVTNCRV
jgi:hypothetical protein